MPAKIKYNVATQNANGDIIKATSINIKNA
jgi:hypothetical protein